MQDFMMELVRNGYIVPLGVVALGILLSIVSVVATYWHKVRMAEMEAALKHKMLDQGMTADDIQKVLQPSLGENAKNAARK